MKINSYTHHFIQNTLDEREAAILNGMWMLIVLVSGVNNCRFSLTQRLQDRRPEIKVVLKHISRKKLISLYCGEYSIQCQNL